MFKLIQVTDRAPDSLQGKGNVRHINPDYIVAVGLGAFQQPSQFNDKVMKVIPVTLIVMSGAQFPVWETVDEVVEKISAPDWSASK